MRKKRYRKIILICLHVFVAGIISIPVCMVLNITGCFDKDLNPLTIISLSIIALSFILAIAIAVVYFIGNLINKSKSKANSPVIKNGGE